MDPTQLAYVLRQLQQNQNQLAQALQGVQGENAILKDALNAKNEAFIKGAQAPERPIWIEDIPGPRTIRQMRVSIDFTYGDTGVKQNSSEIAPDGPFIITDMVPFWQVNDTDNAHFTGGSAASWNGRYLPITAFQPLVNQMGAIAPATIAGTNVVNLPEFSVQLEVAGSGRFWTNDRMPGPSFFGQNGQPRYAGIHGFVERTDRIVVHAYPERTIPHTGRFQMIFNGYQILAPINVAQALGLRG